MRVLHGRLTASDAQVDQTLQNAIIAAATAEEETGGKGGAVSLRGHGGERYVAHVLPLSASVRHNPGVGSRAVAALFVRKAELETAPPSEVIGKTYKLTPTELRVLLAIVNVGGVRQVAGNLGVADTTVKTHLGRLFEKTGVSRQPILSNWSPDIQACWSADPRQKYFLASIVNRRRGLMLLSRPRHLCMFVITREA